MKTELQQRLFDKYPGLFRQRTLPMSKTAMCWGIEVEDGWYDLLDSLCAEIQEKHPGTEFVQVKEKFGELRVYVSSTCDGSEELFQLIDTYTDRSINTCEECGKPGRQRGTAWIFTLCDKCSNEREPGSPGGKLVS